MKFKFKKSKKRLFINLTIGVLWLLYGLFGIIFRDKSNSFTFLILGIIYLILYFFERKDYYLILNQNTIKKDYLFGKSINVQDIKSISEFAGDIIIKTTSKKLTISTQSFSYDDITLIRNELEGLKQKLQLN